MKTQEKKGQIVHCPPAYGILLTMFFLTLNIMGGIINSLESLFTHHNLVRLFRCSNFGRLECFVGKILGSLKQYLVSFSNMRYWTDFPAGDGANERW